jgi:hypothetical protein
MEAFITYDVSARQNDVKGGMVKLGYGDSWAITNTAGTTTYYLPNTSLWKNNTELKTALADIQRVIDNLNATKAYNQEKIILWRCIVLSAAPWDGIPGTGVK